METKKKIKIIKQILFTAIITAAFTIASIILINQGVLPMNKWSGTFGRFTTYKEMFFFGVPFFFFALIAVSLSFLDSKESVCSDFDFICPSCETPVTITGKEKELFCKNCGVKLVPLKGFYDKKKSIDKKEKITK
jgi:DNA-directed RNA polymerase subunit RPC12/RpoP